MKIEKNKVVSIHYTLTDDDGNKIDSSVGSEPLTYYHGNGYLMTGLENELEGKSAGEKLNVTVQPADGYGIYDERLVSSIPRERFEIDGEITVGMQFQVQTPGGAAIVRVVEVGDKEIKIDGNHELAGKVLHFDVEIVDVHEPSQEEKMQYESILAGGCGGGCGGCGGNCGGDCGSDCAENCQGDCANSECTCK